MQFIRGPYGQFIIEKITVDNFSRYAFEIVEKYVLSYALTAYTYECDNNIELSYDVSNLVSVTALKNTINNQKEIKNLMRKMIGSLLTAIVKGLDLLLSPANWMINPEYIFYDSNSKEFRFIYLPRANEDIHMSLLSIEQNEIEAFVNHKLIKPYLTEDEVNSILYFFKENKEHDIAHLAQVITDSAEPKSASSVSSSIGKSEDSQFIILIAVLLFLALYNFFSYSRIAGIIVVTTAFISTVVMYKMTIKAFINQQRKIFEKNKNELPEQSRTDILFDSSEESRHNLRYSTLTSLTKVNGEYIKKSLIADKITIGSDCFLSDIVIDSDDISPLHAQITLSQTGYMLKDLSQNNQTYIENKKIQPSKEYEIKDGQLLTFGKYDFEFKMCVKPT